MQKCGNIHFASKLLGVILRGFNLLFLGSWIHVFQVLESRAIKLIDWLAVCDGVHGTVDPVIIYPVLLLLDCKIFLLV